MTAYPYFIHLRDRIQRPTKPFSPGDGGDDEGPRRPDVNKPDTKDLLKRMKRVDKDQSRRYRQRTGE
ncbi:ubiquitin-like protein UBact [Candidatus Poribacteria bacterium]|nr:ubiquitin-like protein UBact [Candidatus Poribacteria bacterium]